MLIKKLYDQHGIKIKVMRCNNAEENRKMEEACIELVLCTKFEYITVRTLQQNGRIKKKLTTLNGTVRSMMIDAGIKEDLR